MCSDAAAQAQADAGALKLWEVIPTLPLEVLG